MVEQSYVTILTLVGGIVTGLGTVILVILICKHCGKSAAEEDKSEHGDEEDVKALPTTALIDRGADECISIDSAESVAIDRRLWRHKEIRSRTLDSRKPSIDCDEFIYSINRCEPSNLSEWRGVITVDQVDVYDGVYSQPQHDVEALPWLEGHEVSPQNSIHSRPSRLTLNTINYGSRRTLQSSMDSSVCTDNRSEITVIEVGPGGERLNKSVSQDDPRSTPPSAVPRKYLSAFRPVASKRRQSSHSELTTRPHDRMERRIKSHDDTASRRLCHQQEAYDDNYVISADPSKVEANQSQRGISPLQNQQKRNDYQHIADAAECQPIEQTDDVISSRKCSDNSYKRLWKLRSTYEDSRQCSSFDCETNMEKLGPGRFEREEKWRDMISREDTCQQPAVCSVIYTSFDLDSSPNVQDEEANTQDPDGDPDNLLQPPIHSYSGRRQHFQRIMRNRGATANLYPDTYQSSTERSFESFDTSTTDGAHSSDSSRVEVTTSFESTTTNELTDSSADSHSRRYYLRQKDDSGYKSIETQGGLKVNEMTSNSVIPNVMPLNSPSSKSENALPMRNAKTASSRRKEFLTQYTSKREQRVMMSQSSFELDTTDTNHCSDESFDNQIPPATRATKYNILRLLHPVSLFGRNKQGLQRDFSVDQRSDALFREFTRYDPRYDEVSLECSRGMASDAAEEQNRSAFTDESIYGDGRGASRSPVRPPCQLRAQTCTQ